MSDPDQHLFGDDAAGQGGIHIPDHHHQIRLLPAADLLKSHHDSCGLLGMTPGAGLKKKIRPGQFQIIKKSLGHFIIIMLPGMDDLAFNVIQSRCRVKNRRNLHKIRPGPGHQHYPHNNSPENKSVAKFPEQ